MTEPSDNPYASPDSAGDASSIGQLSRTARYLVLVAAFLGWLLAGMQLSITGLGMKPAATDLLDVTVLDTGQVDKQDKAIVDAWWGWIVSAFLLGAAAGGLVFGWIGDRIGRTKALGLAVICYSLMSGGTFYVEGPLALLLLRLAAGLGVGGTWPNGVALVSEAWSNLSRPMLAGIMGTAANLGILTMSAMASSYAISPGDWRWIMLVGAAPIVWGIFVLTVVPESPRWLAAKDHKASVGSPAAAVFVPPLLSRTLLGIGLATVALLGGWGSSQLGDSLGGPGRQRGDRIRPIKCRSVGRPEAERTSERCPILRRKYWQPIGRRPGNVAGPAAQLFPDQFVRTVLRPILVLVFESW